MGSLKKEILDLLQNEFKFMVDRKSMTGISKIIAAIKFKMIKNKDSYTVIITNSSQEGLVKSFVVKNHIEELKIEMNKLAFNDWS